MKDSLFGRLSARRKRIVWLLAAVLFVVIIGCVAFASFRTTFGLWDGMFPAGEYHLRIQDESGMPVQGAILQVIEGSTRNAAFEYPIDNYVSVGNLISDEHGVIVALHKPSGLEFGGSCWDVFWIFPVCSGGPEYDFQISADGYETIEFSTKDLFEPAYHDRSSGNTTVTLETGENVQIPIYELVFTLEK